MYNEHNEMVIGSDGLILCRQHSDNLQASRGGNTYGRQCMALLYFSIAHRQLCTRNFMRCPNAVVREQKKVPLTLQRALSATFDWVRGVNHINEQICK